MMEFFRSIDWAVFFARVKEVALNIVSDHWVELLGTAIVFLVGAWFGKFRQRVAYRKREFFERFNFSLTYVLKGILRIRTVFEKPLREIVFNELLVEIILKAARKTTPEDPFLRFDDPEDQWLVLNAILNEFSEQFAEGEFLDLAGQPVVTLRCYIGITCEPDTDVRIRKVRGLVEVEEFLEEIASGKASEPEYESRHHHVRWKTLKKMAAIYRKERAAGSFSRLMYAEIKVRDTRTPSGEGLPAQSGELLAESLEGGDGQHVGEDVQAKE